MMFVDPDAKIQVVWLVETGIFQALSDVVIPRPSRIEEPVPKIGKARRNGFGRRC